MPIVRCGRAGTFVLNRPAPAMGMLKKMWKDATKSESVELWERPLIARMLWKDRFVFSNSVFRDWWVVQKNRHIFFSMLLSHPLHPFSRRERICMVLALMMFGYVLAAGFELLLSEFETTAMANLARNCTGCAVDFCTASSADSDFDPQADACTDAQPICDSQADPGDSNYCETPTGRQVGNQNWEAWNTFKESGILRPLARVGATSNDAFL